MRSALIIATLLLAGSAEAQFPAPASPAPIHLPDTLPHNLDTTAVVGVDETSSILPLVGGHWSTATGPTGHLAFMLVRSVDHFGFRNGPFVDVEAGRDGGRVGIGLAGVGPYVIGAGSIRLAAMQTWGDQGPLAEGQTYLGTDLRLSFFGTVGVGWYMRVAGDAPGDRSIFTFSGGVGF